MIKKGIAAILLVLGIFIALVLFTYGGPVFPHILGPVVFVSIGVFLLLYKSR